MMKMGGVVEGEKGAPLTLPSRRNGQGRVEQCFPCDEANRRKLPPSVLEGRGRGRWQNEETPPGPDRPHIPIPTAAKRRPRKGGVAAD